MPTFEPVDYDPFAEQPKTTQAPRGVRNNNPLNIESGRYTQSQHGYAGSDGRFARFETPDQGFTAAENLLDVYGRKHGINSVSGVINRWAPAGDGNPVSAYAGAVSRDMGVDPFANIDLANPEVRARLADAMAKFENGQPVPRQGGRDVRVRPVGSAPQPTLTPVDHDPFAATGPQAASIGQRSDLGPAPENADALRVGLEQRARAMTTGPRQDHFAGMVTDFLNQGSAAGQGTTPNIGAQSPNLISTETAENDAGELLYKDPATGQMVPTDQNKHVALRDPADGKIKVFARTADTDEGRLSSAGRILATGMATGAPVARPAIPAPSVVQQTPRASDIFSTAKPHYREFNRLAGQIEATPDSAAGLAGQLRGALEGVNLTPEMAGAAVNSAIKMVESGAVKTLDDLQKVKRMAGRGFNAPEKDARDAAAAVSAEIAKIIEQASPEASKALKTGDQIHSAARGVQDLQRKSEIADLRTGRAGYGGNAVNAMRQVLSPIVQKSIEGKSTGFKPNELAAMREIVEGTTATNTLRNIGMMSPSKGSIPFLGGMSSAGTAGAFAAGPVGLAAAAAPPVIGMVANRFATVMTGKQIDRLKELVAKRSPAYAQAVEKALTRYEKAQLDFISKPSPSKFAAYLSATRSLSAGLNRDGIQITSGDLLKNLQLGGATRAEDEQ